MQNAPKSLRLQIGLFGRTNVGKSSFLNMVCGQDFAITSPVPGTTTDVVEKTMELLPVGPVVFLDTAGVDDISQLSDLRLKKTNKIFDRADIFVLIIEPNVWTNFEEDVLAQAKRRKTPVIVVINKIDRKKPSDVFIKKIKTYISTAMLCSSLDKIKRDEYITVFKELVMQLCPEEFLNLPPILGDLIPKNGLVVLIVPIDYEAPKGRIILPQVQCVRDALDHNSACVVVKESEYSLFLENLKKKPDLVVCDSQVVDKMVKETPRNVKCTTFSILFSRYKGDLLEQVKGALAIKKLKPGDKVLIAEACNHHAIEGDIGRIKIPLWLKKYVGGELKIDTCAGRNYPENLKEYKVIIHCGACMITRREMLWRLYEAENKEVPITNYGVAISVMKGVLERVLEPFDDILKVYQSLERK